jgi:hypothetical protein
MTLTLAKEETILQSMTDKLIEVGRGYGMEINVENTKTRISSNQPPLQIKTDKKRWRMWKNSTSWVA